MLDIKVNSDAVEFRVRVIPRASRTEFVGIIDGVLKVRIKAAPVDGAANEELIKFLARTLGVSKSAVEIVAGQTSKIKRLRITGKTAADLEGLVG
ncbi:MAG TPA: DUF167 domain-containing protein [Pyrinomonadaceae bacterium]|nr:DUF167 domain-containing protein [Pyrinomonadaceae bacterium]